MVMERSEHLTERRGPVRSADQLVHKTRSAVSTSSGSRAAARAAAAPIAACSITGNRFLCTLLRPPLPSEVSHGYNHDEDRDQGLHHGAVRMFES